MGAGTGSATVYWTASRTVAAKETGEDFMMDASKGIEVVVVR